MVWENEGMGKRVFCEKNGEIEGYIFTPSFEFKYGKVTVKDGIIENVEYTENDESACDETGCNESACDVFCGSLFFECRGKGNSRRLILPGLVDVHLHGAAGYDICDASAESIKKICAYERENGIAAFLGATMTLPAHELEKICVAAKEASGYGFEGIFLEGPFVNKTKCGAQNPEYAILPDASLVGRLNEISGGNIRKVLIAPELDGAAEFVECLKCGLVGKPKDDLNSEISEESKVDFNENMIRITLGHSDADYDIAAEVIKMGANQVTHLYNAMRPFDKRDPGLVGAAFDNDCYTELIADGVHVHESVIRSTFKTVSDDKMILVSDSTMATGLPDGAATLGGTPVKVMTIGNASENVSENADNAGDVLVNLVESANIVRRRVELSDGTIAGSATNLYDCMMNAIEMGVPVAKAVRAATLNPAKSVGIDDRYGTIEIGKCGVLAIIE